MIEEYLKTHEAFGESDAVKAAEIREGLHIKPRDLFHIIENERIHGALILSTKRNGGGYFLPSCEADLKLCTGRLLREAETTARVAHAMLSAWEDMTQ